MKKLIIILILGVSQTALAKVPEDKINASFDATYCSALLEYIDSGRLYDQKKSHKLIKEADRIDASLPEGYRTDVIADRNKYINGLNEKKYSKEVAKASYEHFKCDLKI
ncbi:hypothetical protein [Psychromonas ingrahamii]|uniref:hypothetical protein n=1 Tax=Psychromonas ingrahamii TaxID=357794 RepID=UPI0005A136FC|nr:hypothetical protein [Psychromonas ingrahamii]